MNINEKIVEFTKSVEKLSNMEYERIEKEVQDEINQAILDEILEYEQKKQMNFEKVTKNIEKDYNKKIYNYQIQCKKEIIGEENKILNTVREEAIEILRNYTDSVSYSDFLQRSIKNALKIIENNKETTIGITKKDIEKYKSIIKEKYGLEIMQIDEKYVGGCILENKTQGIYIDNTILNSVNEKLILLG